MESTLAYTKRILRRNELRAKKSLGQNFLIDDGVLDSIILGSGLQQGEKVLEIGPGTGGLTRRLLEKAEVVWAVELDQLLCKILNDELGQFSGLQVIHADALKLEIASLGLEFGEKIRMIANLPYYITSPLIRRFLEQREYLLSLTVMVQEEVGKRMTAKPGGKDFGVLSVAVQTFCQAKILFVVQSESFLPAPKVNSAVVHMEILANPVVGAEQEKFFFQVVKAAFGQRRKTLLNSLSQGLNRGKDELSSIIVQAGIDLNARAETLSIEQLSLLATLLA